jgi:hypothetical protein
MLNVCLIPILLKNSPKNIPEMAVISPITDILSPACIMFIPRSSTMSDRKGAGANHRIFCIIRPRNMTVIIR